MLTVVGSTSNPKAPPDDVEAILREYYPWYSRAFLMRLLPGYSWSGIRGLAYKYGIQRITQFDQPLDEILDEEAQEHQQASW